MHSIYCKAFGRVLQTLRRQAELSKEDLAEFADLSRAHVSLLERGMRSPTLDTIMAICRALSISLEDFAAMMSDELDSICPANAGDRP